MLHTDLGKRKQTFDIVDASSVGGENKVIKLNLPEVEKVQPVQPRDGDYAYCGLASAAAGIGKEHAKPGDCALCRPLVFSFLPGQV